MRVGTAPGESDGITLAERWSARSVDTLSRRCVRRSRSPAFDAARVAVVSNAGDQGLFDPLIWTGVTGTRPHPLTSDTSQDELGASRP